MENFSVLLYYLSYKKRNQRKIQCKPHSALRIQERERRHWDGSLWPCGWGLSRNQGIDGLNVNNIVFKAPLSRGVTEGVEDYCQSCLQRSPFHVFITRQRVRSAKQDYSASDWTFWEEFTLEGEHKQRRKKKRASKQSRIGPNKRSSWWHSPVCHHHCRCNDSWENSSRDELGGL